MRFGRPRRRPCDGECRDKPVFLWLPLTLNGETRWLEFAVIEERYRRSSYDEDWWEPLRFINQ